MFQKVFRLDSNYFAFLSGIFASAGVNLVTGILSGAQLPAQWLFIIISALLDLIVSVAWAILAWELADIQRLAIADAPGFVGVDDAWKKLAGAKHGRLVFLLGTAVVLGVVSIIVLVFGYKSIGCDMAV